MVKTIKIKTPQERKMEELEKENEKLKLKLDNVNANSEFLKSVLMELIIEVVD